MKVWFPLATTGTGAEIFTMQLANALCKHGIEPIITRYPKQIEAIPFYLSMLKPPPKIDLIHLNAGSAAGFFHHGLPAVITGHGAFERACFDAYKSLPQKIYHASLVRPGIFKSVSRAVAVTAVSSWVADVYRQDYAASNVDVIPNWVPVDLFSPARKKFDRKLLFAGRNAWQKGSHLLPKLVELLGREFELTCTLHRNEWNGNVPANVNLIGPVLQEKMPEIYRAHDALIMPSVAEGFGLAAAEAMASGLPVFGFRGHGLDDVLEPIAHHCSADMLDVGELAASVRNVFGQPLLYRELSEMGRHHVETRFTEAVTLKKYISLYQNVVSPAAR